MLVALFTKESQKQVGSQLALLSLNFYKMSFTEMVFKLGQISLILQEVHLEVQSGEEKRREKVEQQFSIRELMHICLAIKINM